MELLIPEFCRVHGKTHERVSEIKEGQEGGVRESYNIKGLKQKEEQRRSGCPTG